MLVIKVGENDWDRILDFFFLAEGVQDFLPRNIILHPKHVILPFVDSFVLVKFLHKSSEDHDEDWWVLKDDAVLKYLREFVHWYLIILQLLLHWLQFTLGLREISLDELALPILLRLAIMVYLFCSEMSHGYGDKRFTSPRKDGERCKLAISWKSCLHF